MGVTIMIKYIRGLKIFSIFAFVCTVILWIALWGFSLVPAKQSGSFTDKVTGVVDSVLDVQDKIDSNLTTQSLKIEIENEKDYYYIDEKPKIKIVVTPESSKDTEVVYEVYSVVDEGDASVDADGVVTFTDKGTISLKAALKSNPEVYDSHELKCYGENPTESAHPERKTFSLSDGYDFNSLKVGEKCKMSLNDDKTSMSSVKISVEDSTILGYASGKLYPRKTGETTVTAKFDNGEIETINVTVLEGIVPEIPTLVFKSDVILVHNETVDKMSLLEIPEDADLNLYECTVSSSDKTVVKVYKNSKLRIVGYGAVTLTYAPSFAPDKKISINLTVAKTKPEVLQIIGNDRMMPGKTKYTAKSFPVNYEEDVIWSIVSGNATIDESGVLNAPSYGKVVIRCQSVINQDLFVEKTVKVTLYTSAYMFVRKLMGHAGLSAVLGFGIFGTTFLLCRKKYNCVWSVPIAFFYAGVSELLQKFTPGRYCLMTDVLVDFVGTLVGMAVGIVLVLIVGIAWRLINKDSFEKLVKTYEMQNFGNVFKKSELLDKKYFAVEPEDE